LNTAGIPNTLKKDSGLLSALKKFIRRKKVKFLRREEIKIHPFGEGSHERG